MNAKIIKRELLYKFCIKNKKIFCTTEIGWNKADFICLDTDKNIFFEIEIKISWRDFLNEFKKKKYNKNGNYKKYSYKNECWTPNFFYICAPEPLALKIREFLYTNKQYHYIGVYSIKPKNYFDWSIRRIKKAYQIRDELNQTELNIIKTKLIRNLVMKHYRQLGVTNESKRKRSK